MNYIGFTHEQRQRGHCRIAMKAREWIEEEGREEKRRGGGKRRGREGRGVFEREGGFILLTICKSMD